MKQIIISIVFVVVLIGGAIWLKQNQGVQNTTTPENKPNNIEVQPTQVPTPAPTVLKGESIEIMGRNHIGESALPVQYNSNPPTSGPHAGALPWGFNEKEIADKNVIHNLEHGGIWITYKDLNEEFVGILRDIAKANPQSVIISPREANDSSVTVASWGRLMKMDTIDVEEINVFIKSNINNSPEKLAR